MGSPAPHLTSLTLPARQVLHYVSSGGRSQDSKTPGLAVRAQAAAEKSEHRRSIMQLSCIKVE